MNICNFCIFMIMMCEVLLLCCFYWLMNKEAVLGLNMAQE